MDHWVWNSGIADVNAFAYQCGHCGSKVASAKGCRAVSRADTATEGWVLVCPSCTHPTFIAREIQIPGPVAGRNVAHLPEVGVGPMYQECRKALSAGCFSCAVLACRKLLMHIAVEKGAKEGQAFVEYVQYLSDNYIIPKDANKWVDQLRKAGNEANHQLVIHNRGEALQLLAFAEMLLTLVYEFPMRIGEG